MKLSKEAQEIVSQFQLEAHPEGGFFKEIYRSEQKVFSPEHGEERNALTLIYFLLCKGQVSRFHKVLHDEVWSFFRGAPLKLLDVSGGGRVNPENYLNLARNLGADLSFSKPLPQKKLLASIKELLSL
jgi:predicted cupin superfamily sugar epimerase